MKLAIIVVIGALAVAWMFFHPGIFLFHQMEKAIAEAVQLK